MRCLATLFLLCFASLAIAQDDAVKAQLEKNEATYSSELAKARTDLIAAFDAKIQEVAKSGNLDNVKSLMSEKNDFETAGKLPSSQVMKSAASEHQANVNKAHDAITTAYEIAIAAYTKAMKIDKAKAVSAKYDAFKNPIASNTAKVAPAKAASPTKPAANQPQIDHKYYSWESGNPPKKMIKKD
jgi:hypothetical protein